MKKTLKPRLAAILCAILLIPSLAACSSDESVDKPSTQQSTNSQNQSASTQSGSSSESSTDAYHDITQDSYEEQIKYYMDLTETLQADLVKLKEEAYIDECEYQLKISALEQTIQNLKETLLHADQGEGKLPVADSPDKVVSKSNFKYSTENGQIVIIEYVGSDVDVEIPSNIDGMPVASIADGAFKGALIRSVVIPSSVKEIGWFAFAGCSCLESATIPESVVSIGYGAFDGCPAALKINCDKGSYAQAYAISWGLSFAPKK